MANRGNKNRFFPFRLSAGFFLTVLLQLSICIPRALAQEDISRYFSPLLHKKVYLTIPALNPGDYLPSVREQIMLYALNRPAPSFWFFANQYAYLWSVSAYVYSVPCSGYKPQRILHNYDDPFGNNDPDRLFRKYYLEKQLKDIEDLFKSLRNQHLQLFSPPPHLSGR